MSRSFNPVIAPQNVAQLLAAAVLAQSAPAASPKQTYNYGCRNCGYDDGHRRYIICSKCKQTMKIFICFKGDKKSCSADQDTHTHITCLCGKLKFEGKVYFKTKQERRLSPTAEVSPESNVEVAE
jgi:hypothetical protein